MAFKFDRAAPWYYAADGSIKQAVNNGDGWEFPDAPVGEDGKEIRYVDDPAAIKQATIDLLGFDPDDKKVNQDGSVSIMNPDSGRYEPAVAAGDTGTYMPVSMAQEQELPILQYAMEPKDTGTLGQFLDVADPLMKMYAIASGAQAFGNGLNTLGLNAAPSMPAAPAPTAIPGVEGVQTFPLAPQSFPTATAAEGVAGTSFEGLSGLPALSSMAMPGAVMPPAGPTMPPASTVAPAAAAAATVAGNGATGTEWIDSGEDPMGGPLTLPGEMSIWDKVLAGIKTFSGAAGTANSLLGNGGLLSSLYNIGTGLYGMNQADDMMDFAEELRKQSDPFASERDYYKGKLRSLYDNPASLVETPGYKAGEQAVTRSMAANGYLGSGNMMTELFDYGGKVFDSQAARLAQLAGAGATPGAGGATVANTMDSSNAAMVSALNRIGYGLKGGF